MRRNVRRIHREVTKHLEADEEDESQDAHEGSTEAGSVANSANDNNFSLTSPPLSQQKFTMHSKDRQNSASRRSKSIKYVSHVSFCCPDLAISCSPT